MFEITVTILLTAWALLALFFLVGWLVLAVSPSARARLSHR